VVSTCPEAILYLVGGIPTPLKNISQLVGMIIPNIWKNESHVPNHQPGFVWISSAKHLVYKTNDIGGTTIWVMRKPFGAI